MAFEEEQQSALSVEPKRQDSAQQLRSLYVVYSWIETRFPGATIDLVKRDWGVWWSIHALDAPRPFGLSIDNHALERPGFVLTVLDTITTETFHDPPVLPVRLHVTTAGLVIRDPCPGIE
jgi:hypothetical protein